MKEIAYSIADEVFTAFPDYVRGVVVARIIGAATLLWLRSPDTYRQLLDAVNRATRE